MKKIFFLFLSLSAILAACNNAQDKNPASFNPATLLDNTKDLSKYTTIKWLDSTLNFGTVVKGEPAKVVFRCLNTGDKPLYLIYVRPGCGCTVVDFTKGAIMPGKQGQVMAQYDTNRASEGVQEVNKSIDVTCNAKNAVRYTLRFTGKVVPAK